MSLRSERNATVGMTSLFNVVGLLKILVEGLLLAPTTMCTTIPGVVAVFRWMDNDMTD